MNFTGRLANRSTRLLQVVILSIPVLLFLGSGRMFAPAQAQIQSTPRVRNPFNDIPDTDPVAAERRVKALNADRHRSMVSDTEKLLKLARQLDAEVSTNSTDELTSKQQKEVADIEKLAHSVKEKMARSFADGPSLREPVIPEFP
jgi:hypothetical protein